MRTTVDVEDDVLLAVKERARREGRSAGAVISELARRALTEPRAQSQVGEEEVFYGFAPLPRRGPVVSNELVNRIRDEDPEG